MGQNVLTICHFSCGHMIDHALIYPIFNIFGLQPDNRRQKYSSLFPSLNHIAENDPNLIEVVC